MIASEVVLATVSPKSGDLVGRFYKDGSSQSKFAIGFLLGYEISLNSTEHSAEMKKMEDVVKGYLTAYVSKYYTDLIDDDMKKLKNLNNELAGMKKKLAS